jgi:hypothetical protein
MMLSFALLVGEGAEELGSGDCERISSGLLTQPVNAWSSLAYVAVGLWIVSLAIRSKVIDPVLTWVLGAAVALTGVGSVLFHGRDLEGVKWLHDWSIVAVLAFAAVYDFALIHGWHRKLTLLVYGAAIVGLGTAFWILPFSSDEFSGAVAAAMVLGEFIVMRNRHRTPLEGRRRIAYWTAVGCLAVGAVAQLLGRTDSPVCAPDSLLQPHAAWHVLTAMAMGAWAYAVLRIPDDAATSPTDPTAPDHGA